MNKYQKLLAQIVKDDLKKSVYISIDTNFSRHRNIERFSLKNKSITSIRDFKNFNKKLEV